MYLCRECITLLHDAHLGAQHRQQQVGDTRLSGNGLGELALEQRRLEAAAPGCGVLLPLGDLLLHLRAQLLHLLVRFVALLRVGAASRLERRRRLLQGVLVVDLHAELVGQERELLAHALLLAEQLPVLRVEGGIGGREVGHFRLDFGELGLQFFDAGGHGVSGQFRFSARASRARSLSRVSQVPVSLTNRSIGSSPRRNTSARPFPRTSSWNSAGWSASHSA